MAGTRRSTGAAGRLRGALARALAPLLCAGAAGCHRAPSAGEGPRNHLGAFDPPTLPAEADCPHGTAGCPCKPRGTCGPGLRCWASWCYGGAFPVPDTYYYTARSLADVQRMRERVLRRLELRPGMKVADLGAGEGFHTLAAALAVGATGAVWATDILPAQLRIIDAAVGRARRRGELLAPVHTRLVRSEHDTGIADLPDGSLDVALMIHVLSLFADPAMSEGDRAYFATVARKLRPGGRFFFLHDWIRPGMRSLRDALRFFASAGFDAPSREIPMPDGVPERTFEEVSPGGRRIPLQRGYIVVLRTRPTSR